MPIAPSISELSPPNKKSCIQSRGLGTSCYTHVVRFTTQDTSYSSYSSTGIVLLFGFSQWFFSSGRQQPMRLPYKAKWHLWTSFQVWTVLCESCDQSSDHSGVGVSYTAIAMRVRLCCVVCRAPPVVVLFPWRHTASHRPPAKLNHCYIQVWIQHTSWLW